MIIVLVAAYVAQLVLHNWLSVPVVQLLALSPGTPWLWQLVTYPLVNLADPISALFGMVMLWWGLAPFELSQGRARTLQLSAVSLLGASIPVELIGFALPGSPPLFGAGPLWLGGFTALGWQFRDRQLSFFGVFPMSGKHILLLLLAISVLGFLWSKNSTALIADVGTMAATIAFMRWLDRPAPRRPARKAASGRPSGFKVIQGGADDDRPKWLN